MMLAATVQAISAVWTPENLPIAHIEDRNRYVCNPDGILSPEAVNAVDGIFRAIEDSTGIQSLVAVVELTDPEDCFEFAYRLGEKHGVGSSGTDNGLVIVLSTGGRAVQFVTGYGLEGTLTDAVCRRIQETYMNPFFSDGEWDDGMFAGAQAIQAYLRNGDFPAEDEESDFSTIMGMLFPLWFFLFIIIWVERRRNRCPNCHKHKLKVVKMETILNTYEKKVRLITYECRFCHHQVQRKETTFKVHSTGGNFGGTPFGGGSFGGGSIGGSYGGGHFGGGGAGSRF